MPPVEENYDVVVVGTGPGGEGAAMQASKQGQSVVVVEREPRVGGACTHLGTIPSKALRHTVFRLMEAAADPLRTGAKPNYTFPQLRASANQIIGRQVAMRQGFYERNGLTVVHGDARFVDANTVEVAGQRLRGKNIVIATGSRPHRPDDVDFSHARIFESDSILDLSFTPKSITIYGAGVVGCEYASIFRNLFVKVNLVNTRNRLLDFLDDEIADALSYLLREQGVLIRHSEQCKAVYGRDDGAVVELASGKKLKTDILLWANGRQGNTEELDLPKAGLQANRRGTLKVNEQFQTDVPHIYAVGDVIGYPSLASAAYMQGRAAASVIATGSADDFRLDLIPTGIYTIPEISSVGKTERELTEAKVPYELGHASFRSLAHAQITGRTEGMLKILFHRESLQILGIHCFGANASEIIHIGQAILAQSGPANSLMYFINTTFNYPTMAEAYRVAALNGYNRLF